MTKSLKNNRFYHDGEHGKILEIRAAGATESDGIIEAYLTKWDTIDSWSTLFKKGSFKKAFDTRKAEGIRLIWNHGQLAGKLLEVREDTYGPYVKAKFNLNTSAGKDAYEHTKAGDVKCFSFGFNTIKDKYNGQVREITEIDILECGPVVFEANWQAKIIEVRNDGADTSTTAPQRIGGISETRATDFDETLATRELKSRGWQLLSSLEWTIDDIFYTGNQVPAEIISLVDIAIAKFHSAYVNWLNEYYAQFEKRDGKPPCEFRNALRTVLNSTDTEDLVKNTSLTLDEVKQLASGKLLPLESRHKLAEAGEAIETAFYETRSVLIESLCTELRASTLTKGEVSRIDALLARNKANDDNSMQAVLKAIKDFRSKL